MTAAVEEFIKRSPSDTLYGYALDDDQMVVTIYANDDHDLPPFPAMLGPYRVIVAPIPPPGEGM